MMERGVMKHGRGQTMKIRDKVIALDKIERPYRGRKPQYNPELISKFSTLRYGEAMELSSTFGNVPETDRTRVNNIIRRNWLSIRTDRPSITYTSDGIPRVSVKKA
jgi:hypothetical protein